jgi:hypothetical protein
MPRFYVTGGWVQTPEGVVWLERICPWPIICEGTDRLDALCRSGITVWTEEEWQRSIARRKETDAARP